MYRRIKSILLCFALFLCVISVFAAGCGIPGTSVQDSGEETILTSETARPETEPLGETQTETAHPTEQPEETDCEAAGTFRIQDYFSLEYVPPYSGAPAIEINGNLPFFTEEETGIRTAFESYSPLDALGRCGPAFACVGTETQPDQERTLIDHIHPSGWQSTSYDFVDKGYLYNRCHLIAYSIAGENDNELNLITGTRYFNTEGMLPYENMVLRYVQETGGHVLYRVSPVFEDDNLLASGVVMEAYSPEDDGEGLTYCVYVYNVQPFVTIDYKTGESRSDYSEEDAQTEVTPENCRYVLNISSKKIHMPDCDGVQKMSEHNKKPVNEDLASLEAKGFEPCQNCMHDEYVRWKDQQNHD